MFRNANPLSFDLGELDEGYWEWQCIFYRYESAWLTKDPSAISRHEWGERMTVFSYEVCRDFVLSHDDMLKEIEYELIAPFLWGSGDVGIGWVSGAMELQVTEHRFNLVIECEIWFEIVDYTCARVMVKHGEDQKEAGFVYVRE